MRGTSFVPTLQQHLSQRGTHKKNNPLGRERGEKRQDEPVDHRLWVAYGRVVERVLRPKQHNFRPPATSPHRAQTLATRSVPSAGQQPEALGAPNPRPAAPSQPDFRKRHGDNLRFPSAAFTPAAPGRPQQRGRAAARPPGRPPAAQGRAGPGSFPSPSRPCPALPTWACCCRRRPGSCGGCGRRRRGDEAEAWRDVTGRKAEAGRAGPCRAAGAPPVADGLLALSPSPAPPSWESADVGAAHARRTCGGRGGGPGASRRAARGEEGGRGEEGAALAARRYHRVAAPLSPLPCVARGGRRQGGGAARACSAGGRLPTPCWKRARRVGGKGRRRSCACAGRGALC